MGKIRICDLKIVSPTSEADGMKLYAMSRCNPMNWIFMKRLKLMVDLFEELHQCKNLLEVGFGCGILVPELSSHCKHYTGIDIHENLEMVRSSLSKLKLDICLAKANVCNMPFDDNSFDCIFCMSVLEHISDINQAVSEIHRVLKPGGWFLVGFPIENLVSNLILDIVKLMIGFDRKKFHPTNHKQILSSLEKNMRLVRQNSYPFVNSTRVSLFYTGVWTK